ncbi:RND family transporter [Candidatus Neomarinimicrobiota bacterium]
MSWKPLESRFADWLLRFPILWISFIIGVTILLGSFAARVEQDYTLENMFPGNDEEIEFFNWFKEEFTPDDNIIMLGFEAKGIWTDVQVWHDIENLTSQLETIQGVLDVMSLTTFEDIRGEEGELIVERLVEDFPKDQADLAGLRNRIIADPILAQFLISTNGRVTAQYVEIDPMLDTHESRAQIISDIQAVTLAFPQYEFHISGYPYIRDQYIELMKQETVRGNGMVIPVAIILLYLTFRTLRGIFLPLAVILMSVVWTIGWMGLFAVDLDLMTTIIPSILVVVGLSDCVHLMLKYYEEREEGKDRKEALGETVKILGKATLMTSITTAVGFAVLVTSNIIPMRNFGIFTALGVLGAFVISIIFLTLVMSYLKPVKKAIGKRPRTGYLVWWPEHAANLIREQPNRIMLVASLIVVGAILGIPRIVVDTHIMDDVSDETKVMKDLRFFEHEMSGVATLEIIIDGREEGAVKTPALLSFSDKLAQHLKTYPAVESVISPALMIKDLNQAMHDGDSTYYSIPNDRRLISQYLRLAMISGKDLFENVINFDQSICRVTARMKDVGSKKAGAILADIEAFLAVETPADYNVRITGTTKLIHLLADRITYSLGSSLLLAFLIVSILMGLLFKSPRWIVISLIPNIIPLLVIAGAMGWLGIRLRPTTAAVFSVAFGIAVDDTIHFLSRLKLELGRGLAMIEATHNSLLHTGKAIVATSVLLIAGFGTLLFSDFKSSVEFGFLSGLTILAALIADLYLLPVLVNKFGGETRRHSAPGPGP